jgi:hypothetical protein
MKEQEVKTESQGWHASYLLYGSVETREGHEAAGKSGSIS